MNAATAAVLAKARHYLGTTEMPHGSNRQPFAPIAGHANGYAWCASFVVAVHRLAGIRLECESAWTPTYQAVYSKLGRWSKTPRVGSLALFDFPGDGVNRISHIGIVEDVSEWGRGYVTCLEGNTNPAGGRTGGEVMRHRRPARYIVGFAHPAHIDGGTPAGPPINTGGIGEPVLRTGNKGAAVTEWQTLLIAAGHLPAGSADGAFGPQTEAATKAFQAQLGVTADGVVGPGTRAAIKRLLDYLAHAPVTPPAPAPDRLVPGETIRPGQYRASRNGRFAVTLQSDGNVVVLDHLRPRWHAGTHGTGADTLACQADGNVVAYAAGRPVWQTGTDGKPGSHLVIQDDGNLVLYRASEPLWSSDYAA